MSGRLLIKCCTFTVILIMIAVNITPTVCSNTLFKENEIQTKDETKYYAIIAACSKYKDPDLNIPKTPFQPYSEKQLKCLYDSLLEVDNWNENNIILLLNEQATRQNIIRALENMSQNVGANDVFLFSWQGHGSDVDDDNGDESVNNQNDTKDEVIVTYDIDFIRDDELDYYFSKISAKGMCLIFDCCLSGGLVDRNKTGIFSNDFKNELEGKTIGTLDVNKDKRIVIMGTLNTIGGGGVLSGFALTKAMSLAFKGYAQDKNNDGYISAEEAFEWAKPIALTKSALRWASIWVISYVYNLIEHKDKKILRATLNFLVTYIVNQIISKETNGYFYLNWPNIIDDYDGELLLIKK